MYESSAWEDERRASVRGDDWPHLPNASQLIFPLLRGTIKFDVVG